MPLQDTPPTAQPPALSSAPKNQTLRNGPGDQPTKSSKSAKRPSGSSKRQSSHSRLPRIPPQNDKPSQQQQSQSHLQSQQQQLQQAQLHQQQQREQQQQQPHQQNHSFTQQQQNQSLTQHQQLAQQLAQRQQQLFAHSAGLSQQFPQEQRRIKVNQAQQQSQVQQQLQQQAQQHVQQQAAQVQQQSQTASNIQSSQQLNSVALPPSTASAVLNPNASASALISSAQRNASSQQHVQQQFALNGQAFPRPQQSQGSQPLQQSQGNTQLQQFVAQARISPDQQIQQQQQQQAAQNQRLQALMRSTDQRLQANGPPSNFQALGASQTSVTQALNAITASLGPSFQQPSKSQPSSQATTALHSMRNRQAVGMGLSGSNGALPDSAFAAADLQPYEAQSPSTKANEPFVLSSPVMRKIGIGPCVKRLSDVIDEHRKGQVAKSFDFWKNFVKTFFAPNAKILLDLATRATQSPKGGESAHRAQDESQSIELPLELMPRIYMSKYESEVNDSGISEDRILIDNPCEFLLQNGIVVVDCPHTTVLTFYKESMLYTDGHLRVSFSENMTIVAWEFAAKRREELYSRQTIEKGPLPPSRCTSSGLPLSCVPLLTIAQSINDMKPFLDSQLDQMIANRFPGAAGSLAQNAGRDTRNSNVHEHAGEGLMPTNEISSKVPGNASLKVDSLNGNNAQAMSDRILSDLGLSNAGPNGFSTVNIGQQGQPAQERQASQVPLDLHAQHLQLRTNQLNVQQVPMRLPVDAIDPSQMSSEMLPVFLEGSGMGNFRSSMTGQSNGQPRNNISLDPAQPGRSSGPASAPALSQSTAAWQSTLPAVLEGLTSGSSNPRDNANAVAVDPILFHDGNPNGVNANDQSIPSAMFNSLNGPVSAPPGLSMFTPTPTFGTSSKQNGDLSTDGFPVTQEIARNMRAMSAGLPAAPTTACIVSNSFQNGARPSSIPENLGEDIFRETGQFSFNATNPLGQDNMAHAQAVRGALHNGTLNGPMGHPGTNAAGESSMTTSVPGKRPPSSAPPVTKGKGGKRRKNAAQSNL